jgi:hypothetical protein
MRTDDFIRWNYRDADPGHPLEWRQEAGENPRALVLVTEYDIPKSDSVIGIGVHVAKRADGKNELFFVEEDYRIQDLFNQFCRDLIENTKSTDPKNGPNAAIGRYNLWKSAFRLARAPLSEIQIRGLIGEIIAMRDLLFSRYGQEKTLRAWMNARKGKQDFMPGDRWYEVKTASYGAETVTVTSLEQLDRSDDGRMVVVFLSSSGPEFKGSFTIISLVEEMRKSIESPEALEIFNSTLEACGYSWHPDYEKLAYENRGIREYDVTGDFPRMRASELRGRGIVKATYEISLDSMDRFRV